MILNNTHVQGIFIYSEVAEYEKGDFVVSEDSIYICTATDPTDKTNLTVSGRDPRTDTKNFKTYLGDRITTAQEYFDYLKNPSGGDDKYISSRTLSEILSTYMSGFNEKGIISDYVLLNSSGKLDLGIGIYSDSLPEDLLNATEKNVLEKIMGDSNLNNAIFYISRDLPEIKSNIPGFTDGYEEFFSETDKKCVILKQYSYIDSSDISGQVVYRIQELIDHIGGFVLYRSGKIVNGVFNLSTAWKGSIYDIDFKEKVDYCRDYYIKRSQEVDRKLEDLVGKNFGFRNVPINKSNSMTLQRTLPSENGYIPVPGFMNSHCVINIIVQELYSSSSGGIFKNTSLTIDLLDSFGDNSILNYYINSGNTLSIKNAGNDRIDLSVSSGNIINIYYRQYYSRDEQ